MDEIETELAKKVSDEMGMKEIFIKIFNKISSENLQNEILKYEILMTDDFVVAGGWVSYIKKRIELRRDYHQKHPEEIGPTMAHEIAHVMTKETIGPHRHNNPLFNEWLAILGGTRHLAFHIYELQTYKYKVKYLCPQCGNVFYRFKRLPRFERGGWQCNDCKGKIVEVPIDREGQARVEQ